MTARDWQRELRHSWPLLQAGEPSDVSAVPLSLEYDSLPVRAGVDRHGARHLLVPAGAESVRNDNVDGVVALAPRSLTFARSTGVYLDISCSRPDLFDLFDEVLADVLTTLGETSENPAGAAAAVVHRWRTLLAERRGRLLTFAGRMALFAELTVIELLSRERPFDASWWRGPLKEPHDILLPDRALEVKAIGPASSSVEIHGLHQLAPPSDGPLALVLVRVQEDAAGTSLPDLVGHVLERTDDQRAMIRLLAAVGYSRSDESRYQERFAVSTIGLVEVTHETPRVVPSSFTGGSAPPGIGAVVYRIDLRALDSSMVRGESAVISWASGSRA